MRTSDAVAALIFGIALVSIGSWLLSRVRSAKESGVARIPLEWPTGFDREKQPIRFSATIVRIAIVGVFFCAIGGAVIVLAITSLAF